jgi:hypothetical protein
VTRPISVGATVRDAYAFLGAHLGGIIGVIWLPMVLITIAQFFTFHRFYNDMINVLASGNPAPMAPALLMLMGYLVAKLLLTALMCVGVVQLALGGRPSSALIYISFGPAEGRLFRAFCGFVGLLFMSIIIILILANIAVTAAGARSAGLQEGVSAAMMLALLAGAVLVAARFLALAPAIAVGESQPVLRRAWTLSAGNFWRLVAVLLALFLPLLLFFVLLEAGLGQKGAPAAGSTPELQVMAAMMHARQILPLTCGLSFFFSPLMIGLYCGASVSAWRALKDEPAVDIAV